MIDNILKLMIFLIPLDLILRKLIKELCLLHFHILKLPLGTEKHTLSRIESFSK